MFTTVSVRFNRIARDLSSSLKTTYGDSVSISQFEKMCAAVPSMTEAQQGLLFINQNTVDLLQEYRSARAARDSERDNFRGDTQIANVDTGLDALGSLPIIARSEAQDLPGGDEDG